MSELDLSLVSKPQNSPASASAGAGVRLTVPWWTDVEGEPCAARMLGLGRSATYAGIRSGEIPSVRVGGRILVPIAGLYRMLGMDDRPGAA